MATKTITLEIDAYEKLLRAKRHSRESFTSVVRRLPILEEGISGRELIEGSATLGFLSEEDLDVIDSVSRWDSPPEIP